MSTVPNSSRSLDIAVEGEQELLQDAGHRRFAGWREFRFRLLSAAALQWPPFEDLLALDAARGVAPLEHQLGAVRQLLGRLRGRGMLCDEVGMGKTVEAGLALLELVLRGLVRTAAILVPPSLVGQWQEELAGKFNLRFRTPDDPDFKGWDRENLLLASLHTAKREPQAGRLAEREFDLVIVDEAHHLRNERTLSFKLAQRLRSRYLFLLTATPVQNGLEDLFNLVSLVRPGQLATAREFRRLFVRKDEPLLPNRVEELRERLRDVMIRNRRATSGVRFTRRYATTLRVEMSEPERALYEEASRLVRTLHAEGRASNRILLRTLQAELGSSPAAAWPTLGLLGERAEPLLRSCRAIPQTRKTERLLALVREFNDRLIVFTRFQATQREILRALQDAGVPAAALHGGMRYREKQESLRRFEGPCRILVSTDVGSEGRNLQFCNAIVNFDLPWNPMAIEQRIGRISRIGQEREVYVFNLAAAGTLEDRLLDLLHAKINMFELVIGEIDSILGHLEEERSLEDVLMDLWSRGPEEFGRSLDELGAALLQAKSRYVASRETEDRIFGSELGSGDGIPS